MRGPGIRIAVKAVVDVDRAQSLFAQRWPRGAGVQQDAGIQPATEPDEHRPPLVARQHFGKRDHRARGLRRLVRAVAAQALIATLQQLVDRQLLERVEFVEQHRFQALGHLRGVAMGAADRLAHDLVDEA